MYCLELATNAGIVFSSPTSQTRNYYQFYLDLFCSLPFVQHWKNDHNDRIAEQKKRVKKKLLHKNDSTKKSTFFCLFVLLIPKFTVHNFIQTQLHSSVIYWQSWPEEIIWL